ncbi:hypothetical protein [Flammeovirga aprica]|uniref:Uncharacterized protein n=1 Tax=Flammeovirga aprica JL-4 TaxID=694437 RepID=A0A7X9XCD9_9BACT|nr:hypothetical protein [Flammeovirga aprica]NME71711.1 hypothetical protein [Flammeovirga aprica JL-4]
MSYKNCFKGFSLFFFFIFSTTALQAQDHQQDSMSNQTTYQIEQKVLKEIKKEEKRHKREIEEEKHRHAAEAKEEKRKHEEIVAENDKKRRDEEEEDSKNEGN